MRLAAEVTETENLFETLANKSPVGLYIVQDGRFCYTNATFQTATGYREDELPGRDSLELAVPEDREKVRENAIKMLKGEPASPYQFRVTNKDGSIKWVMESVVSIQYRGRRATLGTFIDITERKKAEEALQTEKNKLQSLIDAIENDIRIQDRDYNIIYQNEPSRISSDGDHLGEKCYRVYEGRESICIDCPVEKAFKDGKPHTSDRQRVLPSGELSFWENTANPIRDARGRVASCLEIGRDITERKEMEEALRESEKKLRLISENSRDIICLHDPDHRYVYISPACKEILGYEPDELVGTNPWELVHPEDIEALQKEGQEKALQGMPVLLSYRIRKKSGEYVWFESVSQLLKDGAGNVLGFVTSSRDITERKLAVEALRQSEEKYRTILEEMEDAYFEVDLGGHFTFVNNSVCRDLGYSREELIGMSYKDFTVEDDIESVFQVFNEVYRTGLPNKGFPWKTVRKDGVYGFAETSISTLRNDKGEIIGFRGVGRDVTERNQAEEAIKQAAEEWRKTFDSISDSVSIHDRDFRVQRVNKAFVDMCHVKPRQVIGKLCYEVMADMHETIPNCPHQETLRTGKPAKTEFFVVKKGAYIEISTSPIFNKKREVVGTVHITRDITERKRMEEALRQSEENYRALFDSSVIGTIVIDTETSKVLVANQAAAKIFGFSSVEEGIEVNPLDFVRPEDKERISKIAAENLFGQDSRQTYELGVVTRDGREIWINATGASIMHEGKLAGLISFTDITEQKRQRERLMVTDRLASLGELAAGTAHELNNPLTSIIGFSQLLMEKETPDDIREDLKLINNEAQRAVKVTRDLLTFARKHAPVKQHNQINSIIEDVLELRAYLQKMNGIEVERQLDPDLPEIKVDYFQMQQVLLNIIINAEYFMTQAHNKGTLTITTKKQNSSVVISIADDGPGILPEDLRRIFDPFFTTKEAGSGTGLGLSICHGIVTEHGGQIYVKSQLGKGATIFVELPINSRAHIKSML